MIMFARWGSRRPGTTAGRVLHRSAVVVGAVAGVLLMLTWAWLYFGGYWAS
jgi:hypothetical protein